MKFKLTVFTLTTLLVLGGFSAIAQAQEEAVTVLESMNVGNKICPISGEKVGEMGGPVEVEYQGKIYNLCCGGCLTTFNADPEAAIQKINEELETPEEFDIHAGHNH